ncbi:hypothetical protein A3Q56_02599 [Intoshia linei]|uniref:Uncharacterized protein n=1 Tax=Intoshia linei TaxID=1819745 RepID=A0A177B6A8_9BILA|nr:hypothetical protein A3Q56_02599 [Intoshia linei]
MLCDHMVTLGVYGLIIKDKKILIDEDENFLQMQIDSNRESGACSSVGFACVLIALYVSFYYNVIIAWSIFYVYCSFQNPLPWTTCGNYWNSKNCQSNSTNHQTNHTFPTDEFFERYVLQLNKSNGLDNIGLPDYRIMICLLITYFFHFMILCKGVRSSGKAVWITATLPYVILVVLLVRGVLLPGSTDGILYFITPNLSRLKDINVWIDAAIQVFYSVGAGFGVHVTFASYNNRNKNFIRDCIITCLVNTFTSLLAGIVVFSYLGHLTVIRNGQNIKNVAIQGPGLVFSIYPEAVSKLEFPSFWAIFFFLMLISLGIDSAMGGFEAIITAVTDELSQYNYFMKHKKYCRYVVTFFAVTISFFFSLPNITYILIIASFISNDELIYESSSVGTFKYPVWIIVIGWLISASSILAIPLYAIYMYFTFSGTPRMRIALMISPEYEHDQIKKNGVAERLKLKHWISI